MYFSYNVNVEILFLSSFEITNAQRVFNNKYLYLTH